MSGRRYSASTTGRYSALRATSCARLTRRAWAVDALRVMRRTADRLIALGVSQSHDLSGTVFQRLIADRKFLATFYTRPESAALLAHLAIPDDGGWDDAERVKDFRIADYACGTGTLIHGCVQAAEPASLARRR